MKSTKIVVTIGPSCDSADKIRKLFSAGMNVARLNFSHGSHEYFSEMISNIRDVSDEIGVLLDTKGPEIRTGVVDKGEVVLEEGKSIDIMNKEGVKCSKGVLQVGYEKLDKLKKGDVLLVDDGLIEIVVVGKKDGVVKGKVVSGGLLGSRKTVSIIGHSVEVPFLSDQDRKDILFGIEKGVDFIAASFVRCKEDVLELRKFLKENEGGNVMIISKIEHGLALKNITDILKVSDGIMVARGDLGVETPPERVPRVQQDIIRRCNELGKPVIVATHMLESMRGHPRPTRAEVSDVAEAILQGTDAIMLSAETATGKYPIKCVEMMSRIANEYDNEVVNNVREDLIKDAELARRAVSLFVTRSAYFAWKYLNVRAILTPTTTGYTPRNVSRFKPKCPIFAITHDMRVLRQLQLSWGVYTVHESAYISKESLAGSLVFRFFSKGLLEKKDLVVVTAGFVPSQKGDTSIVEIHKVEEILSNKSS